MLALILFGTKYYIICPALNKWLQYYLYVLYTQQTTSNNIISASHMPCSCSYGLVETANAASVDINTLKFFENDIRGQTPQQLQT